MVVNKTLFQNLLFQISKTFKFTLLRESTTLARKEPTLGEFRGKFPHIINYQKLINYWKLVLVKPHSEEGVTPTEVEKCDHVSTHSMVVGVGKSKFFIQHSFSNCYFLVLV